MNIRTDILWRVYLVYGIMFLFAFAVGWQVWRVQILEGKKWRMRADSLSTKYASVEANRGNILSDDGSFLATSLPEYELRLDGDILADHKGFLDDSMDSLSVCLANLFQDRTAYSYKQLVMSAVKKRDKYFLFRKKVSFQTLNTLKGFPLFNKGRFKSGLIAIQKNKRIKPFGNLAERTIGYYTETVQPVGLEGAYRGPVAGSQGKQLMERISGGVWVPINDEAEIAPKDGKDIRSTINVGIQDVAQSALYKYLVQNDADHGCVVVMEVNSGEVKAIANLTKIAKGEYAEKYNYAIGEATEPGSTFKLATYLVALEDRKIDTATRVGAGESEKNFHGHWVRDAHAMHGVASVQKAFEISSNVATVEMIEKAYGRDPMAFINGLRRLGLNKKLRLQVQGEAAPRIKSPLDKDWSNWSLDQIAYGYETSLTPMQMLVLYNAIANNGTAVAPLFVKSIETMGKPTDTFSARIINPSLCSSRTCKALQGMLEAVVDRGTAKSLKNNLYQVAGKTGTAQIANGTAGYREGKTRYISSFCGYFPAERPRYTIIAVVNDPTAGEYYAATVACPIFKEIADRIFASHLDMHPATYTLR